MLTKRDLLEALKPIYQKLDILENGQRNLEVGQSALETSMKALESNFIDLGTRQDKFEEGLNSLQHQIQALDNKMDIKFKEQSATMAVFFHETWASVDKLTKKTKAHIASPHS